MIKKVIKEIKENYKFYLLLIFIVLINTVSLDYQIYSPGGLEELNDRIIVDDSYKYDGSFNLTYVTARRGTPVNLLLACVFKSWDIISLDESRVEDESSKEISNRGKIYLKETSYDAIIAAFKAANMEYNVKKLDVTVSYIFNNAKTNLKIGDIIKTINGVEIYDFESLKTEISKYKENDKLNIKVLRDNKLKDCYSILKKEEDKIIIGISLVELKDIETTPKVEYLFEDNESGSSRGLLCALDIYNKISEFDLTRGLKISGTGSIDENGNVGEISGVKYKLAGAVKNDADIFIVPTANYKEAIKLKNENNYNIEIIEADTLENVIEKLKQKHLNS